MSENEKKPQDQSKVQDKPAKKSKGNFITGKESRAISKYNSRITKSYEKRKKRKNVDVSEYITQMKDPANIVEFENLHTFFFTDSGVVKAVNGVTFSIPQGSTVGVVGESGCGKSVTAMSLMQLVQAPQGQIMNGDFDEFSKDSDGNQTQTTKQITSSIRFKSTTYKEENGQKVPIWEYDTINGVETIRKEPVLDKKGKPVLAEDGTPKLKDVQKKDHNGIPLFETEQLVYDIAKMPTSRMRKVRGREISMIFQEPMTSLNPVYRIGPQIDEVVLLHVPGATKSSAKARTCEMLRLVGINADIVYNKYPHELSGGMRQTVIIAMSLVCDPKLVIADEPTTALDVTIQAQILELLRDVKDKISGSIMLITHDLGVIAEMADFVVVMYAGKIIEMGTTKEIFDNPQHPYTVGLQKSKPAVGKKVEKLYSIPGSVPNPINMPKYCHFHGRCDRRFGACTGEYPGYTQVSPTHKVACHLYLDKQGGQK